MVLILFPITSSLIFEIHKVGIMGISVSSNVNKLTNSCQPCQFQYQFEFVKGAELKMMPLIFISFILNFKQHKNAKSTKFVYLEKPLVIAMIATSLTQGRLVRTKR